MKKALLSGLIICTMTVFGFFSCGRNSPDGPGILEQSAIPTDIQAIAGDGTIDVSWSSSEIGAAFKVYYGLTSKLYNGDDADNGPSPVETAPDAKKLNLAGLQNNSTYFIVVTAIKNGKESAPSVEVSATPIAVTDPVNPDLYIIPSFFNPSCKEGDPEALIGIMVVSNAGSGGSISFSVSENAPWLRLWSTGSQTQANIYIYVDCTSLNDSDDPEATITVTYESQAETAVVSLNVTGDAPEADLNLNKSSMTFNCITGDSVKEQSLTISNDGTAALNFNYESSRAAIWLEPSTGTIAAGGSLSSALVKVNCASFSVGTHGAEYLRVKNTANSSDYGHISITVVVTDPSQANIAITNISPVDTDISLSWTNVSGATQYELLYGPAYFSEGNPELVDIDILQTAEYSKTLGVGCSAERYFRVRVKLPVQGPLSEIASAVTRPCAVDPTYLSLIAEASSFTVSFKRVSNATEYNIRYREKGTSAWSTVTVPDPGGSSIDTMEQQIISGISAGITYEVQVNASNASGASPWSEILEVMPGDFPAPNPLTVSTSSYEENDNMICTHTFHWSDAQIDMSQVEGFKFYRRYSLTTVWAEDVYPKTQLSAVEEQTTRVGIIKDIYGKVRAIYTGGMLGEETNIVHRTCGQYLP